MLSGRQCVLVLSLSLSFIPGLPLAANLGFIEGTVGEATGTPVGAAQVKLMARDGRAVDEQTTDEKGHFEFKQVPFGRYQVVATKPDGTEVTESVSVAASEVRSVDLHFAPSFGEEITVTAPRPKAPAPTQEASSASTVDRRDIEDRPKGDSATVNEVLGSQPGFVYDAFGNLYARGNHANIQYQIDGVPLPDSVSGLFGGFMASSLIENMELITGGLGAEYGDRLAAVVNLNTRQPSSEGEGELKLTYGSFGTANPSVLAGKRFDNFSILVGGSYERSDRALDPPAVEPILHDRGDEERGFVRLDLDLSEEDHFTFLGNFARNFYQIPLDPTVTPCTEPSLPDCGRPPDQYGNPSPPFIPLDTNSTETERDLFALLSYRHDYATRASFRASAYYRNSYGFLFGDAEDALGPTADPGATTSDVTRRANHLGGTTEYLVRLGGSQVVRIGGELDELLGSDDFSAYTRNDLLGELDPSKTVRGSDTSRATTGGIYVTDRAALGKLTVNAGLRLDLFRVSFENSTDKSTQTGIGPRLGAAYAFTPSTVAHAFFGLMWMPPPVLDTPAAARILGAVPANAPVPFDLRPERDRYAELGVESRVIPELTLKLTVWGKLSDDQLDDVEVGNTNLVAPYNFEQGRAAGSEAGAVLVLSRWLNAFGNLAYEQAEGRGIATAQYLFSAADLANGNWQTLDHAQTWTVNAGATVKDGGTLFSALANYGSGLRTGPLNNEHVPGHVVVDVTLAHEFSSAPLKPSVAIDVVNLFDSLYAYRISNGFNGSHWAPERSMYLRLGVAL
jgi:outer membrane cobalamin receptor